MTPPPPPSYLDPPPGTALAEAKRLIVEYGYHCMEAGYCKAVFALAPLPEIDQLLAAMLRSGDREMDGAADLFVQDVVCFTPGLTFAQHLPYSATLPALRANLLAPDYVTRHSCIHSLGRIGPRSNAQHLAAMFPWYLEHDPLNVGDLLGELQWLQPRTHWAPCFAAIVAAPLYLSRWAAVEHLWSVQLARGERRSAPARACLEQLAQDAHPRVRDEAAWRLDALNQKDRAPSRQEPDLDFFMLRIHVSRCLGVLGRKDYDLALVERIIAHLQAHPLTPGVDVTDYWTRCSSSSGTSRG